MPLVHSPQLYLYVLLPLPTGQTLGRFVLGTVGAAEHSVVVLDYRHSSRERYHGRGVVKKVVGEHMTVVEAAEAVEGRLGSQ